MNIFRFVLTFLLFAALVFLMAQGLAWMLPDYSLLSIHFPVVFVFLFLLTVIVYSLSYLGLNLGPEYGVIALLGGVVIKMIGSLALIFYLFVKYPDNQRVLALNFFSIYLLFTTFEVTVILCNLRDQNKK